MKKLHLTLVAFCCALLGMAQSNGDITFSVDMSDYGAAYTAVYVSGSFNGFSGTSNPMVNVGGSVWEATVPAISGGGIEYLYTVDNWTDLENFDPASSCTISTELGYVHRFYNVDGDASIPTVCWNSCDACAVDSGCTDLEAENFNPEASVDDGSCMYQVSVGLHTPFQFEIDLPIEVHFIPQDTTSTTSGDHVFEMGMAYADESLWQTTALLPSGTWSFLFSIEGGLMEDPMNFEDNCYEEGGRSFELGGEGPVDLDYWCWQTCNSNCSPIGCTDPTASNYFYGAQEDDGSCLYLITFAVDLTTYLDTVDFADVEVDIFWSDSVDPMNVSVLMDVDTSNVWLGTVELPEGEYFYRFTDYAAAVSETDIWNESSECFNWAMMGRQLFVEGTQDLDVVCWGSCYPCLAIAGCMDPTACNFNPEATYDDNQPGCEFASKSACGCAVVFYLMLALRARLNDMNCLSQPVNMAQLLDLVALATVADVVPLDLNNRILVEQGLRRIRAGQVQAGMDALLRVAGKVPQTIVSSDFGFALGPRLNAAGRLDDMSLGIECLLTDNPSLALSMAQELDEMNRSRREIEQGMQHEAMQYLKDFNVDNLPVGVCLYQPDWHQGVIGILASRIKDKVHRPVIAFAADNDDAEPELKGSARSIAGLHMRDALDEVDKQYPGLIKKFGGHAMAAGLTLNPGCYQAFSTAFNQVCQRHLSSSQLEQNIDSDGELLASEYTLELAQQLRWAGPWGQNFPEPVFHGRFRLVQQRIVGERHLKMVLQPHGSDQLLDAIQFNIDPQRWPNLNIDQVTAAFQLDVNEFRGQITVQLLIRYLETDKGNV